MIKIVDLLPNSTCYSRLPCYVTIAKKSHGSIPVFRFQVKEIHWFFSRPNCCKLLPRMDLKFSKFWIKKKPVKNTSTGTEITGPTVRFFTLLYKMISSYKRTWFFLCWKNFRISDRRCQITGWPPDAPAVIWASFKITFCYLFRNKAMKIYNWLPLFFAKFRQ